MSSIPLPLQDLVRQLFAATSRKGESSDQNLGQFIAASDRLRIPLIRLAGVAGFNSLLSRALALAKRQIPSLNKIRVGERGSLETSDVSGTPIGAADLPPHASEVLLGEFLGLLFSLIGKHLTLSIVQEVWPDISIDVSMGTSEEKDEQQK